MKNLFLGFGKPNRHAIKFTGALLEESRIAGRVKCNSNRIQYLASLYFHKKDEYWCTYFFVFA